VPGCSEGEGGAEEDEDDAGESGAASRRHGDEDDDDDFRLEVDVMEQRKQVIAAAAERG
jgi:hypothetical protein